jgi:hypothetical protein
MHGLPKGDPLPGDSMWRADFSLAPHDAGLFAAVPAESMMQTNRLAVEKSLVAA